jgi:hypothetical protein
LIFIFASVLTFLDTISIKSPKIYDSESLFSEACRAYYHAVYFYTVALVIKKADLPHIRSLRGC